MSLSGRLPTSVRSLSSRNLLPAFGPRLTTSSAVFGGSASMTELSAADSSPGSASVASPPVKIIEVVSPAVARSAAALVRGVPHCEQNRAVSGLASPHPGQ